MTVSSSESIAYHEARLLLLIDAFTHTGGKLDGLTKLAKLDFLLRYPTFLEQLAESRGLKLPDDVAPELPEQLAVESKMVRYKYGPWDDRYYPVLGRLIGSQLVEVIPGQGRLALRVTDAGKEVVGDLRASGWARTYSRARFLKRRFDKSGNVLKEMIYAELPAVVDRPLRAIIG